MAKRRKLKIVGSVIAVLGCAFCAFTHEVPMRDGFAILHGRYPDQVVYFHPMADTELFNSDGEEVRLYEFRADYDSIAGPLLSELKNRGFRQREGGPRFASWRTRGLVVNVCPGRVVDQINMNGQEDPSWTTVSCASPMPDNARTTVRLVFSGISESLHGR